MVSWSSLDEINPINLDSLTTNLFEGQHDALRAPLDHVRFFFLNYFIPMVSTPVRITMMTLL